MLAKVVFVKDARGIVRRRNELVVVIGIRLPPRGNVTSNRVVLLTICNSGRIIHMLLGCNNLRARLVLVLVVGITITYSVAGISPRRHAVVFMSV